MNQQQNPYTHNFKPRSLELKALSLELTLETLQRKCRMWESKYYKNKKKGKDVTREKKEVKQLREAVDEVFEKCNVIWHDVRNLEL